MVFTYFRFASFLLLLVPAFLVLMQPGLDYQPESFLFLVQWLGLSIPWCITDYW